MDITVSARLAKGGTSGIDVWCVERSFGRNPGDVWPIATASFLLKWGFVKLLGGAYLVYVAVKHFFFETFELYDRL